MSRWPTVPISRLSTRSIRTFGKYVQRGGKLIMYKGWNDAGVPPGQPVDYYDRVVKKIGAKAADDAVRLYMVPGMNMCSGGDGADTFDWFGDDANVGGAEANAG